MNLGLMKRRRGVGKSLPYDAEIEYLQSNGTNYIEIPINFAKTDEILLEGSILETTTDKYLVAPKTWNTDKNRFGICGVYGKLFGVAYGSYVTGYTMTAVKSDKNIHIWEYFNYNFKIDSNVVRDVSNITFNAPTTNLRLFWGYNAPTEGRIKKYNHYKGNVSIELISVRIGDVGYLYDKISGQFFGGEGFILGPDK